jgi:hypothetical protein
MRTNRRDFLKAAAAGASLASAVPGLAVENFSVSRDGDSSPDARPVFHSRHIPIELLNLDTPTGKAVVQNGLCDTTKPDALKRLRDLGVELVEMRFVWWEIEPAAGRFDWSRALRDIDAVLASGLKVGMFAWFQYPPPWYDPEGKAHARLRAVGGKRDSSVLSPWDPKTLDVYDRLLAASAETLKGKVSFVYNAISGDYGEVTYSLAANHYKFSSPVNAEGLFGDRCARASFAQEMRRKHGSIDALNRAWGTSVLSFDDDLMPKMPFANNPLRQRDDCAHWAADSLLDFADKVCGLYRKHFPGVPGGLPIGFVREDVTVGQIKSRVAKLAAKHGLVARWTGCAHLGSFDRSHPLARRLASAAHFYGAPFGTEAVLIITKDNAGNALYESMANGAAMIHDDPQNIFRAVEVHKAMRPSLCVDPPDTSVVVSYPVEDDLLHIDGFAWDTFIRRCAELRRLIDYDVCDGDMIADGYLKTKTDLFFPVSTHVREETAAAVSEFAAARGRVWLYGNSDVGVLHQPTTLVELAARRGLTPQDAKTIGKTGLCRVDDWRQAMPYLPQAAFTIPDHGRPCYRTLHRRHESCFFPEQQRFEVRPRVTRP